MRTCILFLLFLFTPVTETFYGKVISITDGDTIVVLTDDKHQVKIRLEGIDCPEGKQDYGNKAKQYTASLCFDQEVRVEKSGTDRYGRTLAWVYVGNVCVNKALLKAGMAWHYKKFNQDPELSKLEATARSQKIGLWSQTSPIPPWEFRKRK